MFHGLGSNGKRLRILLSLAVAAAMVMQLVVGVSAETGGNNLPPVMELAANNCPPGPGANVTTRVTITTNKTRVTPGESFKLTAQIEYECGGDWYPLKNYAQVSGWGVHYIDHPYADDSPSYGKTNGQGKISWTASASSGAPDGTCLQIGVQFVDKDSSDANYKPLTNPYGYILAVNEHKVGDTRYCDGPTVKGNPPPTTEMGEIIIVKHAPSTHETFSFIGPEGPFSLTQQNNNGKVTLQLPAGVPHIFEEVNLPDGWSLSSIECNNADSYTPDVPNRTLTVTLQPKGNGQNQTATCTFTNSYTVPEPTQATLTVIKKLVGAPEGVNASDFEFTVVKPGGSSATVSSGNTVTFTQFGSYNVVEAAVDNYKTSYSDDCSGTIAAGDEKTCTVTNTYVEPAPELGTIKVVKNASGANRFTQFQFTIQSDEASDVILTTTGASGTTSKQLPPGTYSVAENVPTGWFLQNVNCGDGIDPESIYLGAGKTVTCTFTNEKAGGLQIIKLAPQASSRPQTPFAFTVDYGDGSDPVTKHAYGKVGGFLLSKLAPGSTVTVSENLDEEWEVASIRCLNGASVGEDNVITYNVQSGKTPICTVINRLAGEEPEEPQVPDHGTITVVKEVEGSGATGAIPANGFPVSLVSFDDDDSSEIQPAATNVQSGSIMPGASHTFSVPASGPVTITENLGGLSNWKLSDVTCYDGEDEIGVELDDNEIWIPYGGSEDAPNITCTITNTYTGGGGTTPGGGTNTGGGTPPPPPTTTTTDDDETEIPVDEPEAGPEPADDTDGDFDLPAPAAGPDLPATGGNYLLHLLGGTALTGLGSMQLIRRRRTARKDDEADAE